MQNGNKDDYDFAVLHGACAVDRKHKDHSNRVFHGLGSCDRSGIMLDLHCREIRGKLQDTKAASY